MRIPAGLQNGYRMREIWCKDKRYAKEQPERKNRKEEKDEEKKRHKTVGYTA